MNFNLRLAELAEPGRAWRIVTSDEHSTVWDGDNTLFDINMEWKRSTLPPFIRLTANDVRNMATEPGYEILEPGAEIACEPAEPLPHFIG